MSRLAIPWLAVLVLDAPPTAMTLLAVADVAASALVALLLGALVGRWPTRTMIAADLARSDAVHGSGDGLDRRADDRWLVVVVAVNGALTVAFELAQSAWIARSTAQDQLTQRNSALAAGVDASVCTLGYTTTLVSGALAEHYGARALLFASSALIGVAALAAWMGFRIDARRAL